MEEKFKNLDEIKFGGSSITTIEFFGDSGLTKIPFKHCSDFGMTFRDLISSFSIKTPVDCMFTEDMLLDPKANYLLFYEKKIVTTHRNKHISTKNLEFLNDKQKIDELKYQLADAIYSKILYEG